MAESEQQEAGDLWVFGYGSLMWRPGFTALERAPARLKGLHRALCVYSFFHRGRPEQPGLVLGLDRGGMCRGIAYRVAASARAQTIAYLRGREQVTAVYRETTRRVDLEDGSGRQVRALCYIVDRGHVQSGLKRWSQHSDEGSCDEHSKAAFGSDWPCPVAVARSPLGGWTR